MKDMKPTIYDIAKEAGVSAATVSRVLNHPSLIKPSTMQKVQAAMDKLGFDKSLLPENDSLKKASDKSNKNNLLFLLNIPSMNNPYYGDIFEGAQAAASRYGHFLLLSGQHFNDFSIQSLITMINTYHISGIISMSAVPDSLLLCIQKYIPIVQCSEYSETCSSVSYVSIDDVSAGRKAVEYAISIGHRKVALLSSPFYYRYAGRRKTGYIQALRKAGIDLVNEWIIQVSDIDFSMASFAASRLFALPNPPDAVFAVSDVFAAAAIKAAATAGLRVPEDVVVIGFDNVNISVTTTPSITTISQPRYQLGYTAFEILLNEAKNPNSPKQQILLDTELIIRDSTTIKMP